MVGYLFDDLPDPFLEGRIVWFATMATSPAAFDEKVMIIIPEFNLNYQFGPCMWQSRGSNLEWEFTTNYTTTAGEMRPHDVLPKRGDRCLVIFDNRRQPWVVAWWPYDG